MGMVVDLDFVYRHCFWTATRFQCRKCGRMYKTPERAEKHLEECLKIAPKKSTT